MATLIAPTTTCQNLSICLFKIATTRAEKEAAFKLVYRCYLAAGLCSPNAHQIRVTPHQLIPTSEVFINVVHGEIATTVTLVRDSSHGLPLEVIYPAEVSARRADGLHLAELCCYADRRGGDRRFLSSFQQIMGLAAQYARAHGVDELIAVVHPRHARFYTRYLGFQIVGSVTTCPHVEDNPAVAMSLNFSQVDRNPPPCYDNFFGQIIPAHELRPCGMSAEEREYFADFLEPKHSLGRCFSILST